MTLTPEQWDLIYAGIPSSFADGSTLHKFRSQQFVPKQDANFPLCIVSIISQGIPPRPRTPGLRRTPLPQQLQLPDRRVAPG